MTHIHAYNLMRRDTHKVFIYDMFGNCQVVSTHTHIRGLLAFCTYKHLILDRKPNTPKNKSNMNLCAETTLRHCPTVWFLRQGF